MDKKLIIAIAVTIVYALITLIGVLNHEIWADEAQTWMLCSNLSVPQLINHLHNEGHPLLFYLIVMPFAKISENIICQQILCWFAVCIAVFVLLYKSTFPTIVKLAIITSGGFLYFFSIINRNYSIIPILVFLAAILYTKRKEKPILYAISIFFLANTHAIMFGFSSILTLLFTYETIKEKISLKSKNYIAIGIMCIGLLLLLLQLHDTTSSNSCISYDFNNILINFIEVPLLFFVNAYSEFLLTDRHITLNLIEILSILSLFITFILLLINLFFNNKKLFFTLFGGLGFQFGIYIFIYGNKYCTRVFSGLLILIFCFWILYKENYFNDKHKICTKKATTILLSIFFFLTCHSGFEMYKLDISQNYAGVEETANYIKNNISKDSILLVDNEAYSIALAYYLKDDFKLCSVIRQKYLTHVVWDKISAKRFSIQAWSDYCNLIDNNKNIYIIRPYAEETGKIKQLIMKESKIKDKFKVVFSSTPCIKSLEGHVIYKYERD